MFSFLLVGSFWIFLITHTIFEAISFSKPSTFSPLAELWSFLPISITYICTYSCPFVFSIIIMNRLQGCKLILWINITIGIVWHLWALVYFCFPFLFATLFQSYEFPTIFSLNLLGKQPVGYGCWGLFYFIWVDVLLLAAYKFVGSMLSSASVLIRYESPCTHTY